MLIVYETCAGGPSIISDYAWGEHSCFIDVGGAHGSFLAKLLTSNTGTTGILFDQAQVSTSININIQHIRFRCKR